MSRKIIADAIQESCQVTAETAHEAAGAVIDQIVETLKQDGKFVVIGFGTFSVRSRAARTGTNPATGEKIEIKASKTVHFKPTANLKNVV